MPYGFHDFAALDGFGASDADGFLRQTTMNFADAAARDAALTGGIVEEGMRAYTRDANTYWWYDGSNWVIETEPAQSWTPTVTQSGTVSKTVNWGWYRRSNGLYEAQCKLTFTGSGTSTNAILISTPLTQVDAFGAFVFYDSSLGEYRVGNVLPNSTTTYSLAIDEGVDLYGIAGTDGITNNDVLWLKVTGRF